jgi:hypothetical protein
LLISYAPGQKKWLPALTKIAMSSVVQFITFATCADNKRAGKSFAAQVSALHAPRTTVP